MEGLLTALIFDHSLRLRTKAEVSGSQGSDQPGESQKAKKSDKANHFVGKVMNMATSDLNNITGGRNTLLIGMTTSSEVVAHMY